MAKFACVGIGLVLFASGLVLAAEYYTAFSFPPNNKASSDTLSWVLFLIEDGNQTVL